MMYSVSVNADLKITWLGSVFSDHKYCLCSLRLPCRVYFLLHVRLLPVWFPAPMVTKGYHARWCRGAHCCTMRWCVRWLSTSTPSTSTQVERCVPVAACVCVHLYVCGAYVLCGVCVDVLCVWWCAYVCTYVYVYMEQCPAKSSL